MWNIDRAKSYRLERALWTWGALALIASAVFYAVSANPMWLLGVSIWGLLGEVRGYWNEESN